MFVLNNNNNNHAANWLIINLSNCFLKNARFEIAVITVDIANPK